MNKERSKLKQSGLYLFLAVILIGSPLLFNNMTNSSAHSPSTKELPNYSTELTNSGKKYTGDFSELTESEVNSIRKKVNQPYLFTPMAYQTMWPVNNKLCESPSIVEIKFNLKLYTACNDLSKQEGLKMVKEIPDNQGMLFIYTKEQELNFWMNQTYSPLSIAYLDKDFKVVHTAEMIPLDKTNISSIVPAQYALELSSGMMQKLGIEEGVTLSFQPSSETLSFIPEKRLEDQNYEVELFTKYYEK